MEHADSLCIQQLLRQTALVNYTGSLRHLMCQHADMVRRFDYSLPDTAYISVRHTVPAQGKCVSGVLTALPDHGVIDDVVPERGAWTYVDFTAYV